VCVKPGICPNPSLPISSTLSSQNRVATLSIITLQNCDSLLLKHPAYHYPTLKCVQNVLLFHWQGVPQAMGSHGDQS
jgi:hypothetical protein